MIEPIALTLTRERGERGFEAWARKLCGEIALCRDQRDVEKAERNFRAAPTLAHALRMRPLVAHCHVGLGNLARLAGGRDQAQEDLIAATTMYREMDMTFWLQKAEGEMRQLK